jgi:transcriptional regulator with XRE-family HTH domain
MAARRIRQAPIVGHFAERLRALRSSRGMTQRDLAAKANVTLSYISKLEAGGAAPGIDLLERLARALGADAVDLLPAPSGEQPGADQLKRQFDGVVGKAGPETLGMLKLFLDRLGGSAAVAR